MTRTAAAPPRAGPWWRTTWPLGVRELKLAAAAFIVVVAVFTVTGFALTEWFAPNPITSFDRDVTDPLVEARTASRGTAAGWTAALSATETKIIATSLFALAALARWRRWHEAILIGFSLIFEATAYAITSHLVARSRPDVPQLVDSPVDASWSSGHVAAATVYLAIAVVVAWHTSSRWAPTLASIACVAVVVSVAIARMYQGMHYLSDVVAGTALGLVTLFITTRLVEDSTRAPRKHGPHGGLGRSEQPAGTAEQRKPQAHRCRGDPPQPQRRHPDWSTPCWRNRPTNGRSRNATRPPKH